MTGPARTLLQFKGDHMTKTEWITCSDPGRMLKFLSSGTQKKFRLFAFYCLRRQVWHLLDERGREAAELAERLAFGDVSADEWGRVQEAMNTAFHTAHEKSVKAATKAASMSIWAGVHPAMIARYIRAALSQPARNAARLDQVALLRELFHFGDVPIAPSWMAWNDRAVGNIAQSIYDELAFDRMPILADALEDAGCTNPDILNHCRHSCVHVRGCWVVDLILGKE
jgi:hypothetical protein